MKGLIVVGLLAGALVWFTPDAHAEVSASCRVHLQHVQEATGKHVTAAEDRRHWLDRGQKSMYCSEQDAAESSTTQATDSSSDEKHDDKSRYCKRKWYC